MKKVFEDCRKEVVIETKGAKKIYNPDMESKTIALAGVDLKIQRGEFVAIMGPSGSGKTTLLDLIGCLLKPTAGDVIIDCNKINDLNDRELTILRGEKLGFVFQQYHMLRIDPRIGG